MVNFPTFLALTHNFKRNFVVTYVEFVTSQYCCIPFKMLLISYYVFFSLKKTHTKLFQYKRAILCLDKAKDTFTQSPSTQLFSN